MYIYHVIQYTPLHVLTRFLHVNHGVITATDCLAVTTRKRNAGMIGVGESEDSFFIADNTNKTRPGFYIHPYITTWMV